MRALALFVVMLAGACAGASPPPQAASDGPSQKPPAEPTCAAQVCTGDDGGCDMVVLEGVWIWNGAACVEAYDSGCATLGPDCDELYATKPECESAWSRCLQ
jgi:hypothetical protein